MQDRGQQIVKNVLETSKTIRLDEAITYFEKLKKHEDNLIKVVVVSD